MNSLESYVVNNKGRLINKWSNYFDVYEKHFSRFVDKEIVILEIGVSHGGSLQMWKNYFGNKAKIYGIDIDPRCKDFEEENIEIFIGSQADKHFLEGVINKIPKLDILIDDGGHTMKQQIISYEVLFKHIKENGVYLCEDCHTSYWNQWGGGYKRRGSFIEYTKNWIDYLNAFHSHSSSLKVNDFTKNVKSIHYYDSIVVLEKGSVTKPTVVNGGNMSFPPPTKKTFKQELERAFRKYSNKFFGFLNLPIYFD